MWPRDFYYIKFFLKKQEKWLKAHCFETFQILNKFQFYTKFNE